jgi:non-ribosomal peptide synthetase component F
MFSIFMTEHQSPVRISRTSDPAVALLTSSTSAVPKGVVISHGGLRNHIETLVHAQGFGRENVLQQTSLGFDMSLIQTVEALAKGGILVIVPETLRKTSYGTQDRVGRGHRIHQRNPVRGAASLFQNTH